MECRISQWKIEYATELANALNNKKILDNLRDGLPYPYSEQDAKDYITTTLQADSNLNFSFAITVDRKVIGSIGVFRKDNIHFRTAEIGYCIAEPYWGQGIGTSAVKKICDYVFTNTDIIRIFAEPFAQNLASSRILEKAGFIYEGTLRKNAIKNNEIVDMKMYAKIKNTSNEDILYKDSSNKNSSNKDSSNKNSSNKDGSNNDSSNNDSSNNDSSTLLQNLDKLHTTEMGIIRIMKNLSINVEDVVKWCYDKIEDPNAVIVRRGKNWYVDIEHCKITVNAYSYTIITAHKIKTKSH